MKHPPRTKLGPQWLKLGVPDALSKAEAMNMINF